VAKEQGNALQDMKDEVHRLGTQQREHRDLMVGGQKWAGHD